LGIIAFEFGSNFDSDFGSNFAFDFGSNFAFDFGSNFCAFEFEPNCQYNK
jgi:hypothetical protein